MSVLGIVCIFGKCHVRFVRTRVQSWLKARIQVLIKRGGLTELKRCKRYSFVIPVMSVIVIGQVKWVTRSYFLLRPPCVQNACTLTPA
jgi:hypothetical protein